MPPWVAAVAVASLVVGTLLTLSGLLGIDLNALGDLGLIQILPVHALVGLWLVAAVFPLLICFWSPEPGGRLAVAAIVTLSFLLHGIPALIEPIPRYPTAWLHIGFIDQITESGRYLPNLDARYNWPGGFGLGSMLSQIAGTRTALPFIRWESVLMELLWLLPLWAISGAFLRSRRARFTCLWLFTASSWIAQDYLAPQSLTFLLYLCMIAIAVRFLRGVRADGAPSTGVVDRIAVRWGNLVRNDRLGDDAPTADPVDRRTRDASLVAIASIIGVTSFTHQITPMASLAVLVVFLIMGARIPVWFPVVLLAVIVGWMAVGASTFFAGHLSEMIGSFGDLGNILSANVSQRVSKVTAQHNLVIRARMAFTLLSAALGMVGLIRRWWFHRSADWLLLALALTPLPLVVVNGYGGELLLRLTLFSLPFLCIAGADAVVRYDPSRRGNDLRSGILVGALAIVLVPLFLVARWGNEAFEMIQPNDVAAMDWIYDRAPDGARVVALNFAGPYRYRRLVDVGVTFYADEADLSTEQAQATSKDGPGTTTPRIDQIPNVTDLTDLASTDDPPAAYVVLGRGAFVYGEMVLGYPSGLQTRLESQLIRSGRWSVVYRNEQAAVLKLVP